MHDRSGESPLQESDSELLDKTRQGDVLAFNTLLERHGPGLLRLAYSLLGHQQDAEDVLQETFLGAFRGVEKFEKRSSVRTWLGQILVRQAALWRRKNRRHPQPSLPAENAGLVFPGVPNPPQSAELEDTTAARAIQQVDRRMDLEQMLHMLSPEFREVLVLREFEQMSYEEIALALGLPRGTVESRLSRARSALRALFQ